MLESNRHYTSRKVFTGTMYEIVSLRNDVGKGVPMRTALTVFTNALAAAAEAGCRRRWRRMTRERCRWWSESHLEISVSKQSGAVM